MKREREQEKQGERDSKRVKGKAEKGRARQRGSVQSGASGVSFCHVPGGGGGGPKH